MKKKLNLKLSVFELVAYSVLLLVGLWGLVYICLGIASEFVHYKSAVAQANKVIISNFGLGFLYWGIIILAISVAFAVIILLVNAKKSDRDYEKAQRRAQRLKKQVSVVDAEATPVKEEGK